MKALLQIAFWGILGYLFYQWWGVNAVLLLVLLVVLVNLITWDDQLKEIERKRRK